MMNKLISPSKQSLFEQAPWLLSSAIWGVVEMITSQRKPGSQFKQAFYLEIEW